MLSAIKVGLRRDEARILRIAADRRDRCFEISRLGNRVPFAQRRARRRRRELRVERQQDDLVRTETAHLFDDVGGARRGVAHGDEGFEVRAVVRAQRCLQAPRLDCRSGPRSASCRPVLRRFRARSARGGARSISPSNQRNGWGTRMIAGSLNRLNKNGSTASSEDGPPRLKSTTATLMPLGPG